MLLKKFVLFICLSLKNTFDNSNEGTFKLVRGGNAVNAATAAALTETIGWGMANQFDKERGKTFYAI